MGKEIKIKIEEIVGMGIIDEKFTFCLDNGEVEWLIFDDEVIKLMKDFYKFNG